MPRKTKSRSAKPKPDAVVDPNELAFRQVREFLGEQYLEELKTLETVSRNVLASTGCNPWNKPEYFEAARKEALQYLSQEELARVSGVARSIIAKYETGAVLPTLDNARAIYEALRKLGSEKAIRARIDINDIGRYASHQASEMLQRQAEAVQIKREAVHAEWQRLGSENEQLEKELRALDERKAKGKK